jgi:DNA-binding transcriptional regulator YhcF (GntR family)
VRRAEAEWSANRVTVLKAYGMLVERGLVRHAPNGGFYVADRGARTDFARDRILLEKLYEEVVGRIVEETDSLPAAVLKMLQGMAEVRARQKPEVAFVECSRSQAADHAGEIGDRFGIPVLPLSLDEIRGKRMNVPPHIRIVFTTAFHIDEVAALRGSGKKVVALPVEITPELVEELEQGKREAVFLETDQALARRTVSDATFMMGIEKPRVLSVEGIAVFLEEALEAPAGGARPHSIYLVPQREYEGLDLRWRKHDRVKAITCRLAEGAYNLIAEALKIPFRAAV